MTAVAREMSDSASIEPERWEEVLDQLSSMISGKRRADGATWRDAHENMPVYLQVLAAVNPPTPKAATSSVLWTQADLKTFNAIIAASWH